MIVTDPVGLQAWLANRRPDQFTPIVDAYTLISTTQTVVRWVGGDFDFSMLDGRRFVRGPSLKRSKVNIEVGLNVNTLSVTLYPQAFGAPVNFGPQTLLAAAQRGTLDGATLLLERAAFDGTVSPWAYQGRWERFHGTVTVKKTAGGIIWLDALSEEALLDVPVPPETYQPNCRNLVFDARCGLNEATYTVNSSVSAVGSGNLKFSQLSSGLAQAAGYFDLGVFRFTSGPNAGLTRSVKAYAGGVFSFAAPWPFEPGIGNTFSVRPGCNRTETTCQTKFNNKLRFRGEPRIPQPETVT